MKAAKIDVVLWTLYDFANSILAIVFLVYFTQWLVVEKGVPDIAYNALLAGVSLLFLRLSLRLRRRSRNVAIGFSLLLQRNGSNESPTEPTNKER